MMGITDDNIACLPSPDAENYVNISSRYKGLLPYCLSSITLREMMQVSIQEERQQQIMQMLVSTGKVYVHELAAIFNVTSETVRRDLSRMEAQKLLKKVHGGALSYNFDSNLQSRLKFEHNFQERVEFASQQKKKIAASALELISVGDTLLIDFGSTTLEFARALVAVDELTVICNSPLLADVLQANVSIDVILTGGKYYSNKYECLGSVTLDNIANFFADYAVIGAGAIHKDMGFMDQDADEASVARKMIQHSRKAIVLADASKFGQYASSRVVGWRDIDYVVTNHHADLLTHIAKSQQDKLTITDNN